MITNYFKVSNIDFDKSFVIKNTKEIYINADIFLGDNSKAFAVIA